MQRLRGDGQPARVQDNVGAVLDPIAKALNSTPIMGAAPPAWVKPDLAAGFAQTSGAVAMGYHKDALGYFHSKGRATHAAGCAANTTLLTLPKGYRPAEAQSFPVRGNAATYQSLTVSLTGAVSVDVAIAAGGTVDFTISFLVER
jgi:hypothetical protein